MLTKLGAEFITPGLITRVATDIAAGDRLGTINLGKCLGLKYCKTKHLAMDYSKAKTSDKRN